MTETDMTKGYISFSVYIYFWHIFWNKWHNTTATKGVWRRRLARQ